MKTGHDGLRVPVLAIWLLSLSAWLLVAVKTLTANNVEVWPLSFIAFIVSFSCLVMYLTFWWRGSFPSLPIRFVRASLLTTWIYSMLLSTYMMACVMINGIQINGPFIDVIVPWQAFLRLAIVTLVLGLLSLLTYLAFFWKSDRGSASERSG